MFRSIITLKVKTIAPTTLNPHWGGKTSSCPKKTPINLSRRVFFFPLKMQLAFDTRPPIWPLLIYLEEARMDFQEDRTCICKMQSGAWWSLGFHILTKSEHWAVWDICTAELNIGQCKISPQLSQLFLNSIFSTPPPKSSLKWKVSLFQANRSRICNIYVESVMLKIGLD